MFDDEEKNIFNFWKVLPVAAIIIKVLILAARAHG